MKRNILSPVVGFLTLQNYLEPCLNLKPLEDNGH